MNVKKCVAAVLGSAAVLTVIAASPASATLPGNSQGCTPGFWKNHTDWASYAVHYGQDETVAHMLKVPTAAGAPAWAGCGRCRS